MMDESAGFTIAAAQFASIKGDLAANAQRHLAFMEEAASAGVDLLVFPELSMTGFELELADGLQSSEQDPIFAPMGAFAAEHEMLTLVGMPLRAASGKPYIGAVILGAGAPTAYRKIHLHEGEERFFQPSDTYQVMRHKGAEVGCSICADMQHESLAAELSARGATIYACGALITERAYADDASILSGYARKFGMTVLVANFAAPTGGWQTAGKSAVWSPGDGKPIVTAPASGEALVIAANEAGSWKGRVLAL